MCNFFSVTEVDRWDGQTGYSGNNMRLYQVVPVVHNTGIPLFPLSLPIYNNRHRVLDVRIVIRTVAKYVYLAIHLCRLYPRGYHTGYRSRFDHLRWDAHRARDRWCIRVRMPYECVVRDVCCACLNVSIFNDCLFIVVWMCFQ